MSKMRYVTYTQQLEGDNMKVCLDIYLIILRNQLLNSLVKIAWKSGPKYVTQPWEPDYGM